MPNKKVPAKAPVKVPAKAPVKAPVKVPAKAPVKAPVKIPAKAPVKVPVKAPQQSIEQKISEIPGLTLHYQKSRETMNTQIQYFTSTKDLITKYRRTAMLPETMFAIEQVVKSTLIDSSENIEDYSVSFKLKKKLGDNITDEMQKKFNAIMRAFTDINPDIMENAEEYLQQFYVDGRLCLLKKRGIDGKLSHYELLEPWNITWNATKNVYLVSLEETPNMFSYNNRLHNNNIEVSKDDIIYIKSAIKVDGYGASRLHKAMKPLFQVSTLKDHLLVYRMSRAIPTRVFWLDVGNVPKTIAKERLREFKKEYNESKFYDTASGDYDLKRNKLSFLDSLFMSRPANSNNSIETLDAGDHFGSIEDYKMYLKEAYMYLDLPASVIEARLGEKRLLKGDEISADEWDFYLTILKIRKKFSKLYIAFINDFADLSGILSEQELILFKKSVRVVFQDNIRFLERVKFANLGAKIDILERIVPFTGFSSDINDVVIPLFPISYAHKEIFNRTQEEIDEVYQTIVNEKATMKKLAPPPPEEEY